MKLQKDFLGKVSVPRGTGYAQGLLTRGKHGCTRVTIRTDGKDATLIIYIPPESKVTENEKCALRAESIKAESDKFYEHVFPLIIR